MQVTYPPELPISSAKDRIVEAVREHRVVIIAGDTGSGKTTQIPKMCLEAGRGTGAMIGCTQPRRIAAVSVSERVGEELADTEAVGYKIRFHDRTGRRTRIKFMTDGILLAETRSDPQLRQYDTIIIDEAHERSLNIDFLLGYLKALIALRPELKLIVSSATLDTEKFSAHFDQAPIIQVSGRTYPITLEYIDSLENEESETGGFVDLAVREAVGLCEKTADGDILIFMPTERDIMDCLDLLDKQLDRPAVLLPLFGRLHARDQRRIFQTARQRKIVVATNIAETSLTVPGVRFVIDSGLARISRYNPRARTTGLQVRRISRASCDQRAGRCGRTGPGRCIRLYSEEDYLGRAEFTQPEIQRSNLAEVILQMINLQLGDPRDFSFIDPPSVNAIREGYRTLKELDALDDQRNLTKKGKIMAGLPLDPCISRIIIESADNGALREIKVIAAGLSIQDPRIRPLDQEEKADAKHEVFADKRSDFLTLLNIWYSFQHVGSKAGTGKMRKFCRTHFLSWQRMREWQDIHDQIHETLQRKRRFTDNSQPASYAAVHQSLLSGFLRNIGQKKEKNIFLTSGGREVMIFPGSALFNRAGEWIVCASFMETGRLYAMTAANIDARWLERIGGDLCRRSWSDPHWEKKRGQVVALEKVTLFGLIIVAGRKINYGRISKTTASEAREIFIREALTAGQLGGSYSFLQHNMALIQRLQDLEHRTRRKDIIADDATIHAFYDERLGLVYDRHTLNREIKKHRSDRFLWMEDKDILQQGVADDELYRYPKTLRAGDQSIRLSYSFEPGSEADGVTADIPVSLLEHFDPQLFEWLVPGLLEDKITALLRGLPKQLRRRLVPLPDTSARLMDALQLYQGSLYGALGQNIAKLFQVRIHPADWQPDKLPPHLRMHFRLVDGQNKVLFTARSFQELIQRASQKTAAKAAATDAGMKYPEVVKNIHTWTFAKAPQPLPLTDSNQRLTGFLYPMLRINEAAGSVELHYTRDLRQSRAHNRTGLRYLYSRQFPKEVKALERECKEIVTRHTASWLSLGVKASAAGLAALLQDFLLDSLFPVNREKLPSGEEFAGAVSAAKERGVVQTCRQRLDHLTRLLGQRRQLLTSIERLQQSARGRHDPRTALAAELRRHLEELIPAEILTTRQATELDDVPRYLRGLQIRMERAEHSPGKDAAKAQQVAQWADRLEEIPDSVPSRDCQKSLSEFRHMLEEYRISVFAPELGTSGPVSAKRLKRQWREVEESCHQVE